MKGDDRQKKSDLVEGIMDLAPNVGIFVLAFSTIDVHLSKIISFVHPRCAAEGINLKMDRELSKKLGQIRRAFGETKSLLPWKNAMLSIVAEIDSLKNTRDLLSHGAIDTQALHLDTQYFVKMNPVAREPTVHLEEVLSMSRQDMKAEAKKALTVASKMLSVVVEIMEADERR